jgi:hypothetical protein
MSNVLIMAEGEMLMKSYTRGMVWGENVIPRCMLQKDGKREWVNQHGKL